MTHARPTVLIGFGAVAAGFARDTAMARHYPYACHAQVLRDHPHFDWRAVIDPSAEARAVAATEWGVAHTAGDITALEGVDAIEVAVVATPPAHRLALLDHMPGLKAVIVEKPLGRDWPEAQSFVAACRERGLALQVCLPRRVDRHLKNLADGGLHRRIGAVQAAFATYGNGLVNNGPHLIDLVRAFLGEVEAVQAFPDRVLANAPLTGDTSPAFRLEIVSGPAVMVTPLEFCHYRELGLDLWGETGRLVLAQEGLITVEYPVAEHRALSGAREVAADRPEVKPTTQGSALYEVYSDLAEALECGRPPTINGEDALATMKVIEAIRRSLVSGQREVLDA